MLRVDGDDLDDLAGFDLELLRRAVGSSTYERGERYARQGKVLRAAWDSDAQQVSARVVGEHLYECTVELTGRPETLRLDYGDCSCPVGYNCKHCVAALVSLVSLVNRAAPVRQPRASTPTTSTAARRASVPVPAPADEPPEPTWLRRIREFAPTVRPSSTVGRPLAIELSVPAAGPTVRKKLRARVMRQGKTKWVNDNLTWDVDRSWQLRTSGFRPDHVELLTSIHRAAVTAARMRPVSRYGYNSYSSSVDRELDLTLLEADTLWPLLDTAADIGVELIHTTMAWGAVDRVGNGELRIDVTGRTTKRVTPVLYLDDEPAAADVTTLAFIGESADAVVTTRSGSGAAANRDQPLVLVRLNRPVPLPLQGMLLAGDHIDVPSRDASRFVAEAWPALSAIAPVVSSDKSFRPPEVTGPELQLTAAFGADHQLDLSWAWRYHVDGEPTRFSVSDQPSSGDVRNASAEAAVLTALRRDVAGLETALDRSLAGHATATFATDVLPRLQDRSDVTVVVSGDPADYRDVGDSLTIGLSTDDVEGTTDWFDLGVTIEVDGHEIPFTSVFVALAEGRSHLLLADGSFFALDRPELVALHRLIDEARALQDHQGETIRLSRFQADLWDELTALGVVTRQAAAWQRQVTDLAGFDPAAEVALPDLDATLRPYQLDGFRWLTMLWRHQLGGILADDMGLGKTLQTLALMTHAYDADPDLGPMIVLAPTSVVSNWVTEARRFAPQLNVVAITESAKRRGMRLDELVEAGAQVFVTSYTLFRLDHDEYAAVPWSAMVLDEAQQVKNHQAKSYGLVRRLDVPFKLAITGTPMENNLTELWALLSIVAPGLFPNPTRFAEMYARPIERHGDAERLARLRRRIKPLMRRRTKEQVAADLPPKQEQVLTVDLAPKHRKLYDTHLQRERQRVLGLIGDFDRNRIAIFRSLTVLRQLSLHAALVDSKHSATPSVKLDALVEQIDEVLAGGHRALVFSQFTRFLTMTRDRLTTEGIASVYLDGRTRTRTRAEVIDSFRMGKAPVFLISLKAGGVGLNLTEADYVYLLDPWWNPATEQQAADRTHRIGQTRTVVVYRMIARDTIEEKVMALKERKQELFRGVMDDGDLFSTALTADDVRDLLA